MQAFGVRNDIYVLETNVQISGGDVVASNEWLLLVHDLIDTNVCVEVGLNVLEDDDRAIGSSSTVVTNFSMRILNIMIVQSSPEDTSCSNSGRKTDSVVESETEGLVSVLATLAAIEQVLLDILHNGEERAASRVHDGVDTIGTGHSADQST